MTSHEPNLYLAAGRFWRHVIKGPGRTDCWVWVGAIADDGYGRFWLPDSSTRGRVVRPHRYAWALVHGLDIDAEPVVEHLCHNTICVRVERSSTDHLAGSTQAVNLARRILDGRHHPPNKAATYARATAIRAALLDGWDADAIAQAINDATEPDQPTLPFD